MAWIYLLLAGVFEIVWATAMKESAGFTRPVAKPGHPAVHDPQLRPAGRFHENPALGTAYTIWVGIGAVGAFALGILLFGESPSPLRLLAVGLIVAGIVILKLATRQG